MSHDDLIQAQQQALELMAPTGLLPAPGVAPRAPDELMSAANLGCVKAYRLSFTRTLIRRMVRERWRIHRTRFDIDAQGIGTAVYRVEANRHILNFLVFSDDVPSEARTGRLSETRFDGFGVLCHGELTPERIAREKAELPKRSLGRTDADSLGWTLASRSERHFNMTVDALAGGAQPQVDILKASGGYLFRNNGYYGNGRHGSRSWVSLPDSHPLSQPYHAEMFALYLWRHFSFDLAEHMAAARSASAALIQPNVKRYLGMGNTTGLGMTGVMMRWPRFVNAWCLIRETAVAVATAQACGRNDPAGVRLLELLDRAARYFEHRAESENPYFTGVDIIANDLRRAADQVRSVLNTRDAGLRKPWAALLAWADSHLQRESAEVLRSLLTEVYADLVDKLESWFVPAMAAPGELDIIPEQTIGELLATVHNRYGWALDIDASAAGARQHFFYHSIEHTEQRRGERGADIGEQFEIFTDVWGSVQQLANALGTCSPREIVAGFLLEYPEHRFIAERVQVFAASPYAEIRDNVLRPDYYPVHLSRFALANFGMESFTPGNFRWVHGTFLQGAPLADEVFKGVERDWIFPSID